ncbi:hypothetical protein ANCDUO_11384 [Ancylostoma duodenale]|uniref:Uncharacterized protein n=1 Tax=Ancylostoma duodenale TaxID=51022 RepID=A0A0C2GBN3_9BILA|nr:hypothetical protein ANCDUO_11384 [Ancylostoma duodenale]
MNFAYLNALLFPNVFNFCIIPVAKKTHELSDKTSTHFLFYLQYPINFINYPVSGVRHVRNRREFYSAVAMDRVVEVPETRHMQDHVVSWTPDGSRLITFRINLRSVRIFRYLGVERARGYPAEDLCEVMFTSCECCPFQRLFSLESEVMMMMGSSRLESALLRTDCMLFTDDGKYMVVATTAPAPDQLITIQMVYPNHEALPLINYSLEIYTFFTIDLEVIHMLHVDEHGAMIPLKDIGPSIWDDDALYLFIKNDGQELHCAYTINPCSFLLLPSNVCSDASIRYDISLMPCFLFIMDWRNCKILAVYQEVGLVQNFRLGRSLKGLLLISAMSEAMYRRVLSVLPFCGCHHSSSENPYLDPLYFSIDEKIHSNLMYGRMRFDLGSVKIFARRAQHLVCSLPVPPSLAAKGPACVILFHPQDPLAVAFDRVRTEQPLTFYLPSSPEE